jgi:heptosyltransferase-3
MATRMSLNAEAAKMDALALSQRPRILVVTLRRLGDVLLTTPLIRSLRRAYPGARIEALVFADTAGILAGNPDLDGVVTMPPRPTTAETLRLAGRLWRRYDLAVSTQAGDRPTFFARAAGRQAAGLVDDRLNGRIKRRLLARSVRFVEGVHRVDEVLRLAACLGVAPAPEVVAPERGTRPPVEGAYAVIHAAPMFRYKRWTRAGWRALAGALADRGLRVVVTGGPGEAERRYLDDVWQGMDVQRFDGRLGWPEMAALIAGARIYAGPDTAVTHLAAATGCATVALYGPTDPRLWGPWPQGGLPDAWDAALDIQRRGNVWLVQNPLPCLPCQREGCHRHIESHSQCLDDLPLAHVLAAVDEALAEPASAVPAGWREATKAGMESP